MTNVKIQAAVEKLALYNICLYYIKAYLSQVILFVMCSFTSSAHFLSTPKPLLVSNIIDRFLLETALTHTNTEQREHHCDRK